MGKRRISSGTMARDSIWLTRDPCLSRSSACTSRRTFPAPGSAWPWSNASSGARADRCGRKPKRIKGRRFTLRLRPRGGPGMMDSSKETDIDLVLVEDSSDHIELASRVFQKLNTPLKIHVIQDGEEALAYLTTHSAKLV